MFKLDAANREVVSIFSENFFPLYLLLVPWLISINLKLMIDPFQVAN